jgi:hypothetical protein
MVSGLENSIFDALLGILVTSAEIEFFKAWHQILER